jgi:hypothetical protein
LEEILKNVCCLELLQIEKGKKNPNRVSVTTVELPATSLESRKEGEERNKVLTSLIFDQVLFETP